MVHAVKKMGGILLGDCKRIIGKLNFTHINYIVNTIDEQVDLLISNLASPCVYI